MTSYEVRKWHLKGLPEEAIAEEFDNLKSQLVTSSRVANQGVVPVERIESAILAIRGRRVLLDSELAALYGVEVKVLNQAVKRNIERFPADFMFQLSAEEAAPLRSQIVTLKVARGLHRKYLPYAFTEQGVAMLSSVLRSPRAVQVNIEIMRAFVRLRQMLQQNADLARVSTYLDFPRTTGAAFSFYKSIFEIAPQG